MKMILALIMAVMIPSLLMASEGTKVPLHKVIYLAYGGSASANGLSAVTPKPFADGNLWAIPAGAVIKQVSVIVDTAITGTTTFDLGDADGVTSFCPSASVTIATPGIYCNNAKVAGAYLRVQTAGATDAGDIYVVPTSKYYSAAGKYVALDITTTNTAGTARVIIDGYIEGVN